MAEKPTIPDFPNLPDFGQIITQACEVVASVRGIPYDFNGTLSLENKFVVLFKTVKEMFGAQDELVKSYKALYDFVNQYFTNLNLQEEVNNKIQSMSENGSLLSLMAPYIATNTSAWLYGNIINPQNPPIDKSLTVENAAADAKITGDKIELLNNKVEKLNDGGLLIKDEIIEKDISEWLDAHPDATTTVQNGSITESKINASFLPYIKNNYVTPQMFGAKCDNITDDSTSFQNTINFALQNKMNVYIPSGIYRAHFTVTKGNDDYSICIYGDGNNTIINYDSGTIITVGNVESNENLTKNISLKDFRVEGNKNNVNGLLFYRVQNFELDNVYINRCNNHGIKFQGAWDGNVSNLNILSCGNETNGNYALYFTDVPGIASCNAIKFINSRFEICPCMIYSDFSEQIVFTNCKFEKGSKNNSDTYRPFLFKGTNKGFNFCNCIITNNIWNFRGVIDEEKYLILTNITNMSTTDNYFVGFIGCHFYVAPSQTSCVFKGNQTQFIDCEFDKCSGESFPFYLNGNCKIINCNISVINGNRTIYCNNGTNFTDVYISVDGTYTEPMLILSKTSNGKLTITVLSNLENNYLPFFTNNNIVVNNTTINFIPYEIDYNSNSMFIQSTDTILGINDIIEISKTVSTMQYGIQNKVYTLIAKNDVTLATNRNIVSKNGNNITMTNGQLKQFLFRNGYLYEL